MRKHLLRAMIVIAAIVVATARAAEEPRTITFRAQAGDTYINLFGPDWQKAYQENKLTVLRQGKPIASPDIVVEGMIITVTSDVLLTQRALARCEELRQRRRQLSARLDSLGQPLAADPELQAVILHCRSALGDGFRFASDVEFVTSQVEHLESVLRNRTAATSVPPAKDERRFLPALLYGAGFCLAGVSMLLYVLWWRRRPQYPSADAEFREALADVKKAFRQSS